MKKFTTLLTYSAIEDLDIIPEIQRSKIIASIGRLSSNPFASVHNIKKLKAFKPPLYRMRSGNYRVIYSIEEKTLVIMRVIGRKDLEKVIKRLNLSS
ncbi:MAG: type II toxin-antitoxin system RelE/ParE family toxin [Candidatus Aminicenantes bacterium]